MWEEEELLETPHTNPMPVLVLRNRGKIYPRRVGRIHNIHTQLSMLRRSLPRLQVLMMFVQYSGQTKYRSSRFFFLGQRDVEHVLQAYQAHLKFHEGSYVDLVRFLVAPWNGLANSQ